MHNHNTAVWTQQRNRLDILKFVFQIKTSFGSTLAWTPREDMSGIDCQDSVESDGHLQKQPTRRATGRFLHI